MYGKFGPSLLLPGAKTHLATDTQFINIRAPLVSHLTAAVFVRIKAKVCGRAASAKGSLSIRGVHLQRQFVLLLMWPVSCLRCVLPQVLTRLATQF
jgi:hypothetical protein